jgi:hypothetical protein
MIRRIQPVYVYTIFLLLFITATATKTKAQEFGGNPPAIKWKQINTLVAKVIFPYGLDSAGLRVANIVQQMNVAIQPTIGFKQKQISILLQGQTTVSNAYVGLAPFRSEFYLTPEQNSFELGSLPWTDQLAIHEFRHVQQYNNFNVGLSKALSILFGEGGQALGNDLSIPNWFFEGDAVYNETHVSEQGRGRLPFFFAGYRALWAAGRNYSYMKLRNGSYVDYVPDHYPLGYMLVAYGREKYGDTFWKNVTHDAASFKGFFYPFQHAVKKYSGESFVDFKNEGLSYFKKQFHDPTIQPVGNKQAFDSQEFPAFMSDSIIVYLKSTYNRLPTFVVKNGQKETKVATQAIALDNYFDYNNGKIIYTTYRPDLRWGYRDYSELQVLDIASGKQKRLTSRTKYFAPAFNEDGKTIAAVQVSPSGKSELRLLSAVDGKLIKPLPNVEDLFYTYPKFYGQDKVIAAVRNKSGKMSIALITIETGEVNYLHPFSFQPIGFLAVKGNDVYFSATSKIDDKLFKLSINSKKLYEFNVNQSTNVIGSYEPTIGQNKIAWTGFTAFGYKLQQADNIQANWNEISRETIPGNLPDMGLAKLAKDSSADLLRKISDKPLSITNYSKSHRLFNFHSLIPNINDPNYTIAIEGENVLNTFQSQLSFNYNSNEGYKQFSFDGIYGVLFPYLSAGVDYTLDRKGFYNGSNIYWNETELHGGFRLPFNFTSGLHITGLSVGTDLYYKFTNFQSNSNLNKSFTYLNNSISFSNHVQQARQNIYPRFGESVSVNYKSTIAGYQASQFLVSGNLFFPGILINHNLVINAAHQQKGKDNLISFSNNFPFSRGYEAENLHNMNKIGVNYHFPIAYPDAGVGNTVYLLRLRSNLFFDYTRANDFYANGQPFTGNFRTIGTELFFDTKWFNQQSISFGIRYSYLLDNDTFGGSGHNRIELILPVTIF